MPVVVGSGGTPLTPPGSFILTYPPNGTEFAPDVGLFNLQWQPSTGVSYYRVFYGRAHPIPFYGNQTAEASPVEPSPNDVYYWTVVAVNDDGTTEATNAPFFFRVRAEAFDGDAGVSRDLVGTAPSLGGGVGHMFRLKTDEFYVTKQTEGGWEMVETDCIDLWREHGGTT